MSRIIPEPGTLLDVFMREEAMTYDYRIITTAPGSTVETIQHAPALSPWTHETATQWARVEGATLPAGTRIAIDRRRGSAAYQPHRRYAVDSDGIVRRTDR